MKESPRRRAKGIPHVALISETSTAYGRAIIRGATKYIREAGPWTVYIEQRSLTLLPDGKNVVAVHRTT